ncbi:MAG: 2-amino-4-hydroxy-6-hydroxymethyldihydropteridine diphosphokinase [Proteobacteria bacterium]|nr:2-amino-4-hydroxy-6-hydroxymethyldihydropteridine diphosphokinase [Pseudomonadota bacterium]
MILIGLGANMPSRVGTPIETLRAALQLMPEHGIQVKRVSPFYKTAPVPVSDQPDFINAVAEIKTHLDPAKVMQKLLEIEQAFGRQRTMKNDPRTLDLDLLDYAGQRLKTEFLELPHPRMVKRAFILHPLRDIAPTWKHPVSRETIRALIAKLPPQEIQKIL